MENEKPLWKKDLVRLIIKVAVLGNLPPIGLLYDNPKLNNEIFWIIYFVLSVFVSWGWGLGYSTEFDFTSMKHVKVYPRGVILIITQWVIFFLAVYYFCIRGK